MTATRADPPRVAVVGIGAVGGAVAAALGDAGHRPALAARTPFAGLSRTLDGRTDRFDFPVVRQPEALDPVDWMLLCTKAYETAAASAWLARLRPGGTVAVLQNGVDHVERLSAYLDREQILPVVVHAAFERGAPGEVIITRGGTLVVPDTASGRGFAALLAGSAALGVTVEADFVSALWRKLAINATTGGICALTLQRNEVLADPEVRPLARVMMSEAMAVGRALGASFSETYLEEMLDLASGPVGSHWTSLAADRRDGREMEWRERNAIIGRLGREHGIPTPVNDVITALLAVAAPPPR